MGEIQVLQSDLVPLLKDSSEKKEDAVLLDLILRLVINLTTPEILLYREEVPEDKTARNHYLQLQSHRQASLKCNSNIWFYFHLTPDDLTYLFSGFRPTNWPSSTRGCGRR